jgi:hypothetical protein
MQVRTVLAALAKAPLVVHTNASPHLYRRRTILTYLTDQVRLHETRVAII